MAVPRPILLAVLGLLLVTATFMATRNVHQASESSQPASQSSAAQPGAKPEVNKAKPPAKADPPAAKSAEKNAAGSASQKERVRPVRHRQPVSKPAAVSKAVASGKVVVLAFFQKRGADDTATQQAVAGLRHRHLAPVYTDSIDRIGRYGDVVGKLGINQAPAVVIIDSHRHARLVEGYVDPESLAQEVSDARK